MHQELRRKILITGGMGFIGPAITRRFLKNGDDVVIADRLDFGIAPESKAALDEGKIELVETDLDRKDPIYKRISDGEFDVIIHLAAFAFIPLCEQYPDFAYQSNVTPSINILANVPANCRLIIFSSSATYAPGNKSHIESDSRLNPVDVYGWTKKHVEDLTHFYADSRGISAILIRLANAAGPGETTAHLLEAIIRQINDGNETVELGNLTPKRDYIHRDDIAWAIDQLSKKWPVRKSSVEIFNMGTGHDPLSVKEVFEKCAQLSGRKVELKSVKDRQRVVEREILCVDSAKLFSALPDFKPQHIDNWLPALVKNPCLRPPLDPEKVLNKYSA